MINEIKAYPFGPEGVEFFRQQLARSGPMVASLVPQFGKLWSYLPQDAAEKRTLFYLQHGSAFTAEQASDILQCAVRFIIDFLLENPFHFLLSEDRFFAINDPPNENEHKIFEYGGVIYHYRDRTDISISSQEINEAIGSASNYPSVLVLTKISNVRKLPERTQVDEALASELKSNIQHVIQGAFDEEGYLFWSMMREASTSVF
ncbi:MAG TPA: hypothetical protein VGK24_09690 [Candidatus Angelobacter sp.]